MKAKLAKSKAQQKAKEQILESRDSYQYKLCKIPSHLFIYYLKNC